MRWHLGWIFPAEGKWGDSRGNNTYEARETWHPALVPCGYSKVGWEPRKCWKERLDGSQKMGPRGVLYSKCPACKPSSCSFQRCGRVFHQHQMWVKLQFALHLLLLMILQLDHITPPLPPPVSNSSCLFTQCQPLYANSGSILLYFSRHCTIRLKMFSLFFVFVCFLCIICV